MSSSRPIPIRTNMNQYIVIPQKSSQDGNNRSRSRKEVSESDTPPLTPTAMLCTSPSSFSNDGFELLDRNELTPPRTPRGGEFMKANAARNSAPKDASQAVLSIESLSSASSDFSLIDSSVPPVYAPDVEVASADPPGTIRYYGMEPPATPFAIAGTVRAIHSVRDYGAGAFSVVQHGLLLSHADDPRPEVVAVKRPSNKSAARILAREAGVLAYIARHHEPTPNVIKTFGVDPATGAIILPAHELTLETHVRAQRAAAATNISLSTMRAPVVGMRQWLFLAAQLTRAFVALGRIGVVHGDVKWSNILLRRVAVPPDAGTWGMEPLLDPVVIDFSSAHIDLPHHPPEPISALTVSFAAPELLADFVRRDDDDAAHATMARPSFASDAYSLALTLLTAAIGSDPYSIRNATDATRGGWVMCGDPVGFARGDERGLRVSRDGVVDSVLKGCFGTRPERRTGVDEMARRVEEAVRLWGVERGQLDPRWGC